MIVSAEKNKKTVFVKNIAWTTTEDGLKEVFSGCQNVRMPKRPDGSSRGYESSCLLTWMYGMMLSRTYGSRTRT